MANEEITKSDPRLKDLCGMRFGRLIVIKRSAARTRKVRWECQCDCGATKTVFATNLLRGFTKSCGCFLRESVSERRTTHGFTKDIGSHSEYRVWAAMISRCINPNTNEFHNYGGRGISVCQKWRDSFEAFYQDVGPRPSMAHSIDRYPDNDGNYDPGNVRWATNIEQGRNRRNNRIIEAFGLRMCLAEWSESSGLHADTIRSRLKLGWSQELAVTK